MFIQQLLQTNSKALLHMLMLYRSSIAQTMLHLQANRPLISTPSRCIRGVVTVGLFCTCGALNMFSPPCFHLCRYVCTQMHPTVPMWRQHYSATQLEGYSIHAVQGTYVLYVCTYVCMYNQCTLTHFAVCASSLSWESWCSKPCL